MTNQIAYHFLREDMTSPHAPQARWSVGQTRSLRDGEIIPCERGFHGSPSLWDALRYAPGPVACMVELSGEIVGDHGDKWAARSRRLLAAVNIERELRLFAADCAEHVLHLFEAEYPVDDRPRRVIQAARDYANGLIDDNQLAKARDAANVPAAYAANYAADAAYYAASCTAACTAAYAAACTAAYAASANEREWQRAEFDKRFGQIFTGDEA